jgi:hypothetical protein
MARAKAGAAMNEAIAKELFDQDIGKIPDKLIAVRNWKLYSREFPVLDIGFQAAGRSELRIRLTAANWNEAPPSVALLDGDGNLLAPAQLPKNAGSVFHPGLHPVTQKAFVCMAGTLEYHIHPNHLNDGWQNYKCKAAYTVGGIATQIWNAWLKG